MAELSQFAWLVIWQIRYHRPRRWPAARSAAVLYRADEGSRKPIKTILSHSLKDDDPFSPVLAYILCLLNECPPIVAGTSNGRLDCSGILVPSGREGGQNVTAPMTWLQWQAVGFWGTASLLYLPCQDSSGPRLARQEKETRMVLRKLGNGT